MQHRVTIPNTDLNDVLLRLDAREHAIFALKSFTDDGWDTLLAWNPVTSFQYDDDNQTDVLSRLESYTDEQQALGRQVIGYMSYDFGCQLHNVQIHAKDDLNIPLVYVASFDNLIRFNETDAELFTSDPLFEDEVREIIKRPLNISPEKVYEKTLRPTLSRQEYKKAYKKIKDYIQAGDVYQINLTHRLEGISKKSGPELFSILSRSSQSNFQAYISIDGFEVLSFSPEQFITVKDQVIITSPIKGTRPRSVNADKDMALREDLLNSPKDSAELNMITDLMRNDLGEFCEVGSVKIAQKRVITKYPTLWHAHSSIMGTLPPETRAITAMAKLMPGGSITGCPKKRAIEIIDELEATRRNIYTGSIFTIKPNGELDSSIAIRTMIKKADHLYLSVGGGIVHDSEESDEYQESLDKAASFIYIDDERYRLSSDILEQQFGPTVIEILYQDAHTRVICAKSKKTELVLELSRVEFIKSGTHEFPQIHQEIVEGTSIGKAFRAHAVTFVREVKNTYQCTLPDNFLRWYGNSGPATVVSVSVLVGPKKSLYANILETYSSEVRWPYPHTIPTNDQLQSVQTSDQLLKSL